MEDGPRCRMTLLPSYAHKSPLRITDKDMIKRMPKEDIEVELVNEKGEAIDGRWLGDPKRVSGTWISGGWPSFVRLNGYKAGDEIEIQADLTGKIIRIHISNHAALARAQAPNAGAAGAAGEAEPAEAAGEALLQLARPAGTKPDDTTQVQLFNNGQGLCFIIIQEEEQLKCDKGDLFINKHVVPLPAYEEPQALTFEDESASIKDTNWDEFAKKMGIRVGELCLFQRTSDIDPTKVRVKVFAPKV